MVKASDRKMKKYKDFYEEEKQRHEEALERYQEDHVDEMEIINLHKKCNKKARKVSHPKYYPNQMNLKKHYPNQIKLKKYQGLPIIQARNIK